MQIFAPRTSGALQALRPSELAKDGRLCFIPVFFIIAALSQTTSRLTIRNLVPGLKKCLYQSFHAICLCVQCTLTSTGCKLNVTLNCISLVRTLLAFAAIGSGSKNCINTAGDRPFSWPSHPSSLQDVVVEESPHGLLGSFSFSCSECSPSQALWGPRRSRGTLFPSARLGPAL